MYIHKMDERYRHGMACPDCGSRAWSIGRITAECLTPDCGYVTLLRHVPDGYTAISLGAVPKASE